MTEFFKNKLPFKVVSSSVNSGYVTQISSGYKPGIDIVNLHQDTYGELDGEPIQGPFTSQHVGGYQFRHVVLNTGSDNDFNRPEYFKISPTASSIRIYGPDFEDVNKPRGQMWSGAKSPVNIQNIKSTDRIIGNFDKNYQVFQTSGRSISNNLIADGYTASSDLTTKFINGTSDSVLPDLLTSSKSIFVERFNAPGGKEESSRGALDRIGEEFSPNNSLTTRNIKVRQPFYYQLSQHSPQFGSGSTYELLPATGSTNAVSIHKINRNTFKKYTFSSVGTIISSSKYDNFWVQYNLPKSNYGYSWITASAVSNQYEAQAIEDISFNFTSSLYGNIDIDLEAQTLNGSMSGSEQNYSSWRQTKTNEHPVSRKLARLNLLPVQDIPQVIAQSTGQQNSSTRSGNSTNYKEPPVTNKYYPIEQTIKFDDDSAGEQPTKFKYSNRNLTANFSNDSLNDRLNLERNERIKNSQFYSFILNSVKFAVDSPVADILSLKIKENIYPRSLNTYLSGTRSRIEYILDQPGFDRDGYDRQLGTQRVFWRDNQEDRRRSPNSSGGHINSLGYSSLEESGSDFTQNENGILFDNSFINHSASLTQNFTNLDRGINNSIMPLETSSSERELYAYTGSFRGTFYNNQNIAFKAVADIVKRGHTNDIAGEFNNSFVDFYEQFLKDNEKQSIGAIYRNTSYKQMLNSLPKAREDLLDKITHTDDESVFVNPKPRYVAFVGGGELNTGSVFDNSTNFTNEYFNTFITGANNSVRVFLPIENKIYFAGNFTAIGRVPADYIAIYDRDTQKFSPISANQVNGIINALVLSGTDIYACGQFSSPGMRVAKYDTIRDTWSPLSGGLSTTVHTLVLSGTDIYAGGFFTTTGSYISRWSTLPGGNWSSLIGAGGPNGRVRTLVVSGADIYAGGDFLTPGPRVAKYNTTTNTWSSLGSGLDGTVYSLVVSGTDIYAGGEFTSSGSHIAKYDTLTDTWTSLSGGLDDAVYTIIVSGSDIYAGGEFSTTGSCLARWSTLPGGNWSTSDSGLDSSGIIISFAIFGTDIYAGGSIRSIPQLGGSRAFAIYSTIQNNWSIFNTSPEYDTFSKSILNNSLNVSDIKFSTLDSGLTNQKTKTPTYDNSEDYYKSDIYQIAKDYSILPEFKISEHIEYYNNLKDFQAINNELLILDGVGEKYKSADSKNSIFNKETFFEKYSFTDVINKQQIETDYQNQLQQDSVSLNVSVVKKLLPYNGFYPQERTIQLANLYNNYVDNVLSGGVYNLENINDYYNDRILTGNYEEVVVNFGDLNSSIDVERYGDKYYLIQNTTGTLARSYLYSSSASSYKNFSQNIIYSYDNHSGSRIISASNGLNIYSFSSSAGLTASYNHLSIDGTTWSTPVAVIQPHSASDGFGEYWDYIYENNSILGEKILFSIAAPNVTIDSKTNGGVVSFVSATMRQFANGQKYWDYSNKITIGTGSASDNQFGTGISMISCSSGYQIFMGELFGDTTSTNFGNIWVTTSSNGIVWSTPISIVSGTAVSSSLGYNNLKAVNFTKNGVSRSYLFFTEPLSFSSGSSNVVGKFFVVSSSANNNWGTTNINSQRTELYVSEPSTVANGTLFDLTGSNKYSIEAHVGNSGITYCFVNGWDGNDEFISEIKIGFTYDGIEWQKNEQMFSQLNSNTRGCDLVAMSTYERDGNILPVFFTNLSSSAGVNSIYAINNNQFTQFSLNVSGTEKYVKQAALEPVMAPGILYNTIKSGIAVDWPCATGSQTSIEPYGSGTIVNAYYPQSFKMASHQGANIDELNVYGSLKSNIDYRVDFEKLIFPDDIFPTKPVLTSSLIRQTTLTALESTDPLVQFISGTYIYGGYEPYLSPVDVSDYNQLGPKKFSVPFVYKKRDAEDTGLYSMAMSNFLAETVKFFLKDGLLTSFQSKPDRDWGVFISGSKYYMDIVISKTPDLVMMEAYHSDKHPTGSFGEKMNGRYFGYPVNKTDKKLWSQQADDLFTDEEAKLMHNDPAYAPYTPPYFEGEAIARISFSPSVTKQYTIDEIFSSIVVEDIFPGVSRSANTGSDAYINKMPIESSMNIRGKLPWVDSAVESNGNRTDTTNNNVNTWIIGTKFETPILDFSSQELTPNENNYMKSSGYGRGMWSGYGNIPTGKKGIYVSLRESFPQNLNRRRSGIQSLLQKTGFQQTKKNIGIIASEKQISEAIMIIPFIELASQTSVVNRKYGYGTDSQLTQLEKDLGIQFIGINKETYNNIIQNKTAGSILNTYNNMSKFIVPPQLDYKKYTTIDPFVAYIAEFTHTLSQQDLVDIWQGVSPQITTKPELQNIKLSHPNKQTEFYHGQGLPNEDIRFMVFKVKQKGEFNYFKVTKDSTDDLNFSFEQKIGRSIDDYSYNWPYDYFSLVELARIDLEIDYKKKQ